MPQPHKGKWEINVDSLSRRPSLSAHIGRIAALWTMVEVGQSLTLAVMLQSESRFATAMFLRLRGARPHAMDAVAEEVLPGELLREFRKLMQACREVEGIRNDVIHGMWGIDPEDDTVLVWLDPAKHLRMFATAFELKRLVDGEIKESRSLLERSGNAMTDHMASAVAYRQSDFEDIEKRIREQINNVYAFNGKVLDARR